MSSHGRELGFNRQKRKKRKGPEETQRIGGNGIMGEKQYPSNNHTAALEGVKVQEVETQRASLMQNLAACKYTV